MVGSVGLVEQTMRFKQCASNNALQAMRFKQCASNNALQTMRFKQCASNNALQTMRFKQCDPGGALYAGFPPGAVNVPVCGALLQGRRMEGRRMEGSAVLHVSRRCGRRLQVTFVACGERQSQYRCTVLPIPCGCVLRFLVGTWWWRATFPVVPGGQSDGCARTN